VLRGVMVRVGDVGRLGQLIAVGYPLLAIAGSAPAPAECVTVKYRDTPVCLDTFKCVDTHQSSFVRAVCFDERKSYLVIKLNDVWYHYCAVDRASFENLTTASSVGSYYNQNFRSHGAVHAHLTAGTIRCRPTPRGSVTAKNCQISRKILPPS